MADWFIITSAINSEYNESNADERFDETLATMRSIYKKCSEAKIVILDGSLKEFSEKQLEILTKFVSEKTIYLWSFYDDEVLKHIHEKSNGNIQQIKSPSELYLLHSFFTRDSFIQYDDRIFKLSGRYCLSDDFNLDNFTDDIVFLDKQPAVQYYDRNTGQNVDRLTEWQYKTRLYCFGGKHKQYMTDKYKEAFDIIIQEYINGRFTDIEHALYHVLGETNIRTISPIGVIGRSGENGELIKE